MNWNGFKKKKAITMILTLALAVQCISGAVSPENAQASESLSWNGWEYQLNGGTATITGYAGEETELTFPAKVPKEPGSDQMMAANRICYQALKGNQKITSVCIPEGYLEMGYLVFEGCTSLRSVELPASMKYYEDVPGVNAPSNTNGAFQDCTALAQVTIPEGTTALGKKLFARCTSLAAVEVPSTLTDWEYAFQDAAGLKRVTLKEGIQTIPRSAFQNCTALEEINIPDTVSVVDYNAIANTPKLMDLMIPKSLVTDHGLLQIYSYVGGDANPLKQKEKLGTLEIHSLTYSMGADEKLTRWEKVKLPRYSICEKNLISLGYTNLEYLPGPDSADFRVIPYQAEYDGQEHEAVTVSGIREGDAVSYSTEKYGTFTPEMPVLKEPEKRTVWVRIEREGCYSPYQTQVSAAVLDSRDGIRKKLKTEVMKAEALYKEKDNYTAESWSAFETAATEGKKWLEDDTALLPQLTGALEKLQIARGALTKKTEIPNSPTPGDTEIPASPNLGETETPVSPAPGETDIPVTPTPASPTSAIGTQAPSAASAVPAAEEEKGTKTTSVAKAVLSRAVSAGKRTIELRWKKTSGAEGVEILLGTDRKMTRNKKKIMVRTAGITRKKIRKLKSGKRYHVKVRGWRSENGKKEYGEWSAVKTVKVK